MDFLFTVFFLQFHRLARTLAFQTHLSLGTSTSHVEVLPSLRNKRTPYIGLLNCNTIGNGHVCLKEYKTAVTSLTSDDYSLSQIT